MTQRTYTMRARAAAAAATRTRILQAAIDLHRQRFRPDIRLEDIAGAAGVSVQTVLRIFGSRAALFELAMGEVQREILAQRGRAAPGDIDGAIAAIVDHYEEDGDLVVKNLADETDPEMGRFVQIGRIKHREWVERQFEPQIGKHAAGEWERLVDALICVCDVYTWKLLRRDMGRSRAETEATMTWMVRALLGGD